MVRAALVMVAVVAAVAAGAAGQVVVTLPGGSGEGASGESAAERRVVVANPGGWGGGGFYGGSVVDELAKACDLSDEQKEKIKTLEGARDKSVLEMQAASAEKARAAQAALMEAYKSKDKEAIAKAMAAYQQVYAPTTELYKQAHADIMGVLTQAQNDQWQEHRAMAPIRWQYGSVLTDMQWARLRATYADLAKDEKLTSVDIQRKLAAEVKDLLTDEQKAKLQEDSAMAGIKGMFAQANLTEAQWASVKAAYDKLNREGKAKGWELTKQLSDQVRAMLTDEQKEAMKKSGWLQFNVGQPGAAINVQPGAGGERVKVINNAEGGNGTVIVIEEKRENEGKEKTGETPGQK